MVKKEQMRVAENLMQGKGSVEFFDILKKEEMMGHGRLFAKVVLHPGCSIGEHTHTGDTEPYYILKGTGVFTEPDGTKVQVNPGDICMIECGQSHAIENNGTEDLEFIALVIYEA